MSDTRRYLFNAATGLSAAFFLFVLWNWASSHYQIRRGDTGLVLIRALWPQDGFRENSDFIYVPMTTGDLDFTRTIIGGRGGKTFSPILGFEYMSMKGYWLIVLPYWFLFLLAGIMPARWLWPLSQKHRRRIGNLCAVCGYDLRATPEKCPECGTMAAKV